MRSDNLKNHMRTHAGYTASRGYKRTRADIIGDGLEDLNSRQHIDEDQPKLCISLDELINVDKYDEEPRIKKGP